MNESPNKPERSSAETEPRVYAFEEGVGEALTRITRLIEVSSKDILVAINGSDTNVGKTALLGRLGKELRLRGVPVAVMNGATVESQSEALQSMQVMKGLYGHSHDAALAHGVYLVENAVSYVNGSIDDYRSLLRQKQGGELPCDLYIAIYRPDKPFAAAPEKGVVVAADMFICNEAAKDKSPSR